MYVVHYHNEHAYHNPGQCVVYGPYPDLAEAKVGLAKLVAAINDVGFRIDPDPEAEDNDGTYAGFNSDWLTDNERDEDVACEVWAEILEVQEPY